MAVEPHHSDAPREEVVLGDTAMNVLERFFANAAVRGEKGLAFARLAIGILALSRHVAIHGLPAGPDPRIVWSFWLLASLIPFSAWSLITIRQGPLLFLRLRVSVAFDLLVGSSIIAVAIYWPMDGWTGLGQVPETYFLFLALVASGLRQSRRAAWFGVWGAGVLLAGLIALDALHNGIWSWDAWRTLGIVLVLYVGSALIAVTTAARTRRLVMEGASATLIAERARQRMGVYLSEVVAAEALEADDLRIGGARQDVAVLFCDLRGFTAYSETLPPERLVSELNEYLDAMVRAIREQQGVVDKFIGDAVMVVFGVPRPRDDSALRAVRCTAGMQDALREHNLKRAEHGLPPLEHGIGIHFGSAVVGNIGNKERLQYTVIGDVVNLASRLESATKELGVPVLISAAAVEAARRSHGGSQPPELPALESRGSIRVRGRENETEVYTLAKLTSLPSGEARSA